MTTEPDTGRLDFADTFAICMQLQGRLDTLWQRVLYTHAAIVGVMVYFANAQYPHPVPRLLVLLFYTINLLITVAAMRESYAGLVAAVDDLKSTRRAAAQGAFERWLISLDYSAHPRRRLAVLGVVWALVAYLLIYPLVS